MNNSLVVTLNTTYPCHGFNHVRLPATRFVPTEVFDRICPTCGREWTIIRTSMPERPGMRMDRLEWECTAVPNP